MIADLFGVIENLKWATPVNGRIVEEALGYYYSGSLAIPSSCGSFKDILCHETEFSSPQQVAPSYIDLTYTPGGNVKISEIIELPAHGDYC